MLRVTAVKRFLWAFLALSLGVLACPDYSDVELLEDSSNNSSTLRPRWYTVSTTAGSLYGTIWPDSTLPYCFEDDNARTQLAGLLISGWKIWQDAGVPSRADMGESKTCPPAVNGVVPAGPGYLLVRVNSEGKMRTTVGFRAGTAGTGPSLLFDPSPAIGMRDPAANMAHEIGHAWGFYHEQQRRNFWDKSQYPDGTGNSNQINFVCENLAGYATAAATHTAQQMNDACHSYTSAKNINFDAIEFMPMVLDYYDQLDGEFDWDSIMLYGSQIGGRTNADGTLANVYTKASDNSVVTYNKWPSVRDIERFQAMYSAKAPRPNPCLINQDCSPFKATFYKTVAACKKIL